MRLAFIDIETTGGRATRDRITEIALRVFESDQLVSEWQSLVNPETNIPPFITRLTGIDNFTVQDAPTFACICEEFDRLTDGSIFVAHNARFDYAFIKNEFKRLGLSYTRKVLCTVKLAKQLYPEHKRHGLDLLIQRHNLPEVERHRAMGDVQTMRAFYELAQAEHSDIEFSSAISMQMRKPSLPKGLDEKVVNAIPEVPGVYRFYGENRSLLYVGKSVNLYQRVMSHFSSDYSSTKEMTIAQSVIDIDWTETAGDFGAQLLELKQIKSLNPTYNRRSRAMKTLATFKLIENEEGYSKPELKRAVDFSEFDQHFGIYRSETSARRELAKIASKNDLCRKLLGLESGSGPCFGLQIGSCKGACVGEEDPTLHNLRMQIAFHELRLQDWPYKGMIGIKEYNSNRGKEECHIIYNWCHLMTLENEKDLLERRAPLPNQAFDLDTYKLIVKTLKLSSTNIVEIDPFHLDKLSTELSHNCL